MEIAFWALIWEIQPAVLLVWMAMARSFCANASDAIGCWPSCPKHAAAPTILAISVWSECMSRA